MLMTLFIMIIVTIDSPSESIKINQVIPKNRD